MKYVRSSLLLLAAGAILFVGLGARSGWFAGTACPDLPQVERTPAGDFAANSTTELAADESAEGTIPASAAGLDALALHLSLLREGRERLFRCDDHTARFHRQVRVNGTLLDPELVELRVRHEPFSVHMEWLSGDKGRRAAYVQGENEGRMLVRLGGWKSRLPPLRLEPNGSTAMRSSRHPITEAGLLALAERLIRDREDDLVHADGCRFEFARDVVWDDRPCHEFVVEYATRGSAPSAAVYRKSIQYVDQETLLPILVRSFGWPVGDEPVADSELDEPTLVEVYAFSDVRFDTGVGDEHFDVSRRSAD